LISRARALSPNYLSVSCHRMHHRSFCPFVPFFSLFQRLQAARNRCEGDKKLHLSFPPLTHPTKHLTRTHSRHGSCLPTNAHIHASSAVIAPSSCCHHAHSFSSSCMHMHNDVAHPIHISPTMASRSASLSPSSSFPLRSHDFDRSFVHPFSVNTTTIPEDDEDDIDADDDWMLISE